MEKSIMYDTVKSLYEKHGQNEEILTKAVTRDWITEEEKKEIIENIL